MDRLLTDEELLSVIKKRCKNKNAKITKKDKEIAIAQYFKAVPLIAQELFEQLEEKFGLYTDWGGKSELSMIVIKPGDYYSSEDAMERYHAIKSKWVIE